MYAISYRKRGFTFLFWSIFLLILLVGAYFLINILLSQKTDPEILNIRTKLQFLVFFFGFFIASLLPVLLPLGCILLFKEPVLVKELPAAKYKDLSNKKIIYIHDFSWGAFFCAPVWALENKLYWWALGALIPGWNIYVWIRLFIDGRKLAWEKSEWKNFKSFQRRQWLVSALIFMFYLLALALTFQMGFFEYIENNFKMDILPLFFE